MTLTPDERAALCRLLERLREESADRDEHSSFAGEIERDRDIALLVPIIERVLKETDQ